MEIQKSKNVKGKEALEKIIEIIFLISACAGVISVLVIAGYIIARGVPAIGTVGAFEFLAGGRWEPSAEDFGILPMIVGSIYATLGAILVGLPIGLFTAIYVAEYASPKMASILRPAINILAGIPSVVYGFFGLIVIVPMIDSAFGGGGNSLLAVIIILSVMILPTIVSISQTAIKAVPASYKEGALGLGATHTEAVFSVVVPAAKSGIMAAIVLGIGRAIGETMAVILVAGNTPQIPTSLIERIRTMTATIAMEMSYSSGLHQDMLFGIGVILFAFIIVLNILLSVITRKGEEK